jgi:hypothetical protein
MVEEEEEEVEARIQVLRKEAVVEEVEEEVEGGMAVVVVVRTKALQVDMVQAPVDTVLVDKAPREDMVLVPHK